MVAEDNVCCMTFSAKETCNRILAFTLHFKIYLVLPTYQIQHNLHQGRTWHVPSNALRTRPCFAQCPLEKHHCMLKHILASNTHRKIQEFYSEECSKESHYFDIYCQEVKNGSDSTSCKAERTSKTSRDKGIQNRIRAGGQICRTKMLYKT